MKLKTLAAAAVLTLAAACAGAQTAYPAYNESNAQLSLPSVQVGNTLYTNVVIRLDSFAILGVGGAGPAPSTTTPSATCTAANFTMANFNAISAGMTVDQVNSTIGCQYNPVFTSVYAGLEVNRTWIDTTMMKKIIVMFDANGTYVGGVGSSFKIASGF